MLFAKPEELHVVISAVQERKFISATTFSHLNAFRQKHATKMMNQQKFSNFYENFNDAWTFDLTHVIKRNGHLSFGLLRNFRYFFQETHHLLTRVELQLM